MPVIELTLEEQIRRKRESLLAMEGNLAKRRADAEKLKAALEMAQADETAYLVELAELRAWLRKNGEEV